MAQCNSLNVNNFGLQFNPFVCQSILVTVSERETVPFLADTINGIHDGK